MSEQARNEQARGEQGTGAQASGAGPQASGGGAQPSGAGETDAPAELLRLRGSIDNIDAALIHILAERFRLTEAVGQLKARTSLPPADPAREARQVARLRSLAEEADLDPEFAEKFLTFIVSEVIRHHERIADESRTGES